MILALVGWELPNGDVVIRRQLVPLSDAVWYYAYGWHVLIDPSTEADLADWERRQRPKPPWKW